MTEKNETPPIKDALWEAAVIVFWTLGGMLFVIFLVIVPLLGAWQTGEITGRRGAVYKLDSRPVFFTVEVVVKLFLGAMVVVGGILHLWFAGKSVSRKTKGDEARDGINPRP
jgi:hypothetical protein